MLMQNYEETLESLEDAREKNEKLALESTRVKQLRTNINAKICEVYI